MLKNEETEEDFIQEGAEYSPKSEFSKAKITSFAIEKCINARCKEMMAGFWNVKLTKEGSPIRTWQEDTRKVFIGSVISLQNILYPELEREEKLKEFFKEFKKKKEGLWDKYCYTIIERTLVSKDDTTKVYWKKTDKKIMPNIGAVVVMPSTEKINIGRFVAGEVQGGWNTNVNAYYDKLVDLYDSLFQQLNWLVDSLNYFKAKSSY